MRSLRPDRWRRQLACTHLWRGICNGAVTNGRQHSCSPIHVRARRPCALAPPCQKGWCATSVLIESTSTSTRPFSSIVQVSGARDGEKEYDSVRKVTVKSGQRGCLTIDLSDLQLASAFACTDVHVSSRWADDCEIEFQVAADDTEGRNSILSLPGHSETSLLSAVNGISVHDKTQGDHVAVGVGLDGLGSSDMGAEGAQEESGTLSSPFPASSTRLRVVAHIPQTYSLKVRVDRGCIRVSNKVEAELIELRTNEGSVIVDKIRGERLSLCTKDGAIIVQTVAEGSGEIVGGELDLARLMGDELRLVSDGHKRSVRCSALYARQTLLAVRGSSRVVSVTASHGHLSVQGDCNGTLELGGVNGAVQAQWAVGKVNVHLQTLAGGSKSTLCVDEGDVAVTVAPEIEAAVDLRAGDISAGNVVIDDSSSQRETSGGVRGHSDRRATESSKPTTSFASQINGHSNSFQDKVLEEDSRHECLRGRLRGSQALTGTTSGFSKDGAGQSFGRRRSAQGKVDPAAAQKFALTSSFFAVEGARQHALPEVDVRALHGNICLETLDWKESIRRKMLKRNSPKE